MDSALSTGSARKRVLRRAGKLLALALSLWLLIVILLVSLQDGLVFPGAFRARPILEPRGVQAVEFERDGLRLHGWLGEGGAPLTLVYYGGNGEEATRVLGGLRAWSPGRWLVVNYRGYGASEGEPSEKALVDDAVAVLDAAAERGLLDPARTVLVGRSLGTGVAMQVAARREVAGLVLVTPFDSIRNVAAARFPFVPMELLLRHPFDSIAVADSVREPVLAVLAGEDRVIPVEHGRALIEALGPEVRTVELPGVGHDHRFGEEAGFVHAFRRFLEAL